MLIEMDERGFVRKVKDTPEEKEDWEKRFISNNNTEYCYATRFGGKGVVEMIKTKYGYKI